ncbi:MAG: cell division ATP-binding protein FtsE [Oscillospiraceae bacterium]|jgi:cell division transport system ATP-binding protein|nr:cell division ATP-binding protein FtsE [Oscillospiraceae bacterium]
MIRFEHVYKSYENGTSALEDLSFVMEDGEFAFLVGPSGSGKSTVIKLLTGEISATDGTVVVNGYNMNEIRPSKLPRLRRTMGVIFQDFRLIDNKNVFDNIALAMWAVGAPHREIRDRVNYVLGLVGLEDRQKDMPRELSGGEQQRVAIARALANNPKLIIADEPTGNIDPERSAEIMTMLTRINELGTTMLVVTHEQNLVNQFAKRVIRIVNGRLAGDEKGWYIS